MPRRRWLLLPLAVAAALLCWLCLHFLSSTSPLLTGVVLAEGQPVSGARVRVQTSTPFTLTDSQGRFQLPSSPGERLTAWKEGYFIGSVLVSRHPLTLTLTPLPADDAEDYTWIDPASQRGGLHNCAHCHSEIYQEWSASAHGRAAQGKHFRNLYEGTDWHDQPERGWSLLGQRPDGAAVCASCHAPAIPPGDPALFDLREVKGVAAQGVHCDYCHKIAAVADGKLGLTHGRYNLQLLRPKKEPDGEVKQLFFGPFDDSARGEDAYAPLYKQSLYCASCHEGVVFGVPVYTTYSEWLASPAKQAGKQCQDCHMKPTGTMTNAAPGAGGPERPAHTLGNHRFVDGSLPDMLRRAVHVTTKLTREDSGLRATVEIVAQDVGHRVPTGYIDRHLVLVVEGLTATETTRQPKLGPLLPAVVGGPFAGMGGKLYAKLLHDEQGRSPAPFWSADPTPTDSRLSPERPDTTQYLFSADVERVRVRLLYRRFWPRVVQEKGWPDQDVTLVDVINTRL